MCDFCGPTPALPLCDRCLKVHYCDAECKVEYGNFETDLHKREALPPRCTGIGGRHVIAKCVQISAWDICGVHVLNRLR